uniref:Uncharacterized protein n=1 Tax=Falco tinnunculus TaxID=100819 RepID=A0A8C4TLI6_FALTI
PPCWGLGDEMAPAPACCLPPPTISSPPREHRPVPAPAPLAPAAGDRCHSHPAQIPWDESRASRVGGPCPHRASHGSGDPGPHWGAGPGDTPAAGKTPREGAWLQKKTLQCPQKQRAELRVPTRRPLGRFFIHFLTFSSTAPESSTRLPWWECSCFSRPFALCQKDNREGSGWGAPGRGRQHWSQGWGTQMPGRAMLAALLQECC